MAAEHPIPRPPSGRRPRPVFTTSTPRPIPPAGWALVEEDSPEYAAAVSVLAVPEPLRDCSRCGALRAIAPRYLWRLLRPALPAPAAPRTTLLAFCEECREWENVDATISESEAGQERPEGPSRRDAQRS